MSSKARMVQSSSSNESLLAQMEGELASCTICASRMHSRTNPPRILSCLHTFCSQCLTTMTEKEKGAIMCPSCRMPTKATDVSTLAQNFTLCRMLEILEIQESQKFECDECDEELPAAGRCLECVKNLCEECCRFHERRKATKMHSIVTISEFKKNAQELHRPNSMHSEKCLRHAGEALKLYCETCEVLICRDCTMIDHTKPEHRYIFVSEAGPVHRMEIVAALRKTTERVPQAEVLAQLCEEQLKELHYRSREVEMEVRTCLQQQRYMLQQREEDLVAKVHRLRDAKEKILVAHRESIDLYLANVKSSCDFTNRLLDEGTEAEVLATKIQIKKQLGLLATKELSDSPPVDAAVHFYANTQALGEVVNSFASVTASSSFPPLCQAQGDGLRGTVTIGQRTTFQVLTFDQQGERRVAGGDQIALRFEKPGEMKASTMNQWSHSWSSTSEEAFPASNNGNGGSDEAAEVEDVNDGTYTVSYVPSSLGVMLIHVSIQVTPISASPFRVMVVEATCDDKADAAASVDGTKAKSVSKDVGSEEVEALSTTSDERCQELATGSKQQSPLAPPVDGS